MQRLNGLVSLRGKEGKERMIEKDPTAYPLITYSWVFLLSIMGGVVSYIRKRRMGKIARFSITELVGEIVTSAFAGLITFFLCEAAKIPPMLAAAMIAVSGHMGSRLIFMLEEGLQKWYEKYVFKKQLSKTKNEE
ncbi:hypothetical protein GCM10007891_05440 [Methylophaga thalassica]|uniref:LydA holin phage, holin superfamily III n=2 Tax=Methylophaga thalassica TaxID=40223 RepID=A0ABQ5TV38_9GAMM|nr:hypothetical protein GCM10007891_05440 [Methylophaga thalassica]